jgi:hippurate hydrolase
MNAPSEAFLHDKLHALDALADEFIAVRRDIHKHPEMGYKEYRTSDLVAEQLSAWGYQVTRGLGGTGLVGQIKKGSGHRAIGIRADMDALPIDEATGLSYASCNVGIMHACGHDGHTAMLLAAAKHIAQKGVFSGTVNLIFQPAEEGLGGAKKMMEDGLFKQFPCDAIFAMHNMPTHPQGHLVLRDGSAMAPCRMWPLTRWWPARPSSWACKASWPATSTPSKWPSSRSARSMQAWPTT